MIVIWGKGGTSLSCSRTRAVPGSRRDHRDRSGICSILFHRRGFFSGSGGAAVGFVEGLVMPEGKQQHREEAGHGHHRLALGPRPAARPFRRVCPSLIGTALGALRRVVWDPGANHSRGPDSDSWIHLLFYCGRIHLRNCSGELNWIWYPVDCHPILRSLLFKLVSNSRYCFTGTLPETSKLPSCSLFSVTS